jgi:hypothetical protein
MLQNRNSGMNLNKEELIKLKHSIDAYDYQIVEHGSRRILIIRSELEFPDIVNDLEIMINKFDMRDINQLDQAMIIGDAEVLGIPVDAINSLMSRRIEDDEVIAGDLEDRLEESYSTLVFEHEDDPLKVVRLGIKVPGKLEDYKPQELKETLFSKMKSFPRDCEIVYLLADDGYVRMNGKKFYNQLSEFIRDNPDMNKDLQDDIADTARGNLADHFISEEFSKRQTEPSRQEQLGKYIPTPESEGIDISKKIEDNGEKKELKETTELAKSKEVTELTESKNGIELPDLTEIEPKRSITLEPPNQIQKFEEKLKDKSSGPQISPLTEEELMATPGKGTGTLVENVEITNGKNKIDEDSSQSIAPSKEKIRFSERFEGSGTESETPVESNEFDFIYELKRKTSNFGYEIVSGVDIPGVNLILNTPFYRVNRIFISYMPKFDFKRAMTLERSLNRFPKEVCVLVGLKNDYDLKLFIVGKNIILVDPDTILNTDFLSRLEDHL